MAIVYRLLVAMLNRLAGVLTIVFVLLSISFMLQANSQINASNLHLTLDQAIKLAETQDPWFKGNLLKQRSVESMSVAYGSLPDPKLSFTMANLPVDSFKLNQEPMTQIKVGITQQFLRGDSLELKRKKFATLSKQYPLIAGDRRAKIMALVSALWLDAFRAQETINLIEQDKKLFEQLVSVVQAKYSSATGKARQQNLISAQLNLTRLEDRLTMLHSQQEVAMSRLMQWLVIEEQENQIWQTPRAQLAREMPKLTMLYPKILQEDGFEPQILARYLLSHPAVKSLDQRINAANIGVELAKQKYKPQWALNFSYGYRQTDASGSDRPDFVSVGVSLDMPLFTDNLQDKEVESVIAEAGVMRSKKMLLMRDMFGKLEAARNKLIRLNQRQSLYRSRLLKQSDEQATASLLSYTNDDGDFSEVVRSRIYDLNARIEMLDIDVERLKTIAQLNYFFIHLKDKNQVSGETS